MNSYLKLEEVFKQIKGLKDTVEVLLWDMSVYMPSAAIESRKNQMAAIESSISNLISSKETENLIEGVVVSTLDKPQARNFELMKREYEENSYYADGLKENLSNSKLNCEFNWRKAKEKNDFKSITPYLQEVLDHTREYAARKSAKRNLSLYDAVLDNHDAGRLSKNVDILFEEIEKSQKEIVEKIISLQTETNNPLEQLVLEEKHIEYCQQKIINILGFDLTRGRIDKSIHPFCWGTNVDVRITTKNEKANIHTLFELAHELGHAVYRQNLSETWTSQLTKNVCGSSIDEGQALLFELLIKSPQFKEYLSDLFVKDLGCNPSIFSHANFNSLFNRVEKSFIRIYADKVTYPLHIILRYKLEKLMISGKLDAKDLPAAWNEGFFKLFGVYPPSDKEGCLQDIHWYMGEFGNFPTYLLGTLAATQCLAKIVEEYPRTKENIREGKLDNVLQWCKNNVHQHGAYYTSDQLLERATGEPLSSKAFHAYIKEKYSI